MKKYISLMVGAVLTMATFIAPLIWVKFEPMDMGIVFIIAFALIGVALVVGCVSGEWIKFLYSVEAVLLFLLAGVTIYREFFDLVMARDYCIIIFIITLIGVFVGSIIRQVVVGIKKLVCKRKKLNKDFEG